MRLIASSLRSDSRRETGWRARPARRPRSTDCSGKPQHAVAGLDHRSPHVVERVGEERQRAGVLRRILRGALRDHVDEPLVLEARAEQLGRLAHHLAQAVLAERRHVDLQAGLEQRLVALQEPDRSRSACSSSRAGAGRAAPSANEFGEAPPLLLPGAGVKLLALIDVEKKGRRLGLIELLAAALGGVDQVGEGRLALQQLDPLKLPLDALRVGRVELPSVEKTIDQRLDRLGAGLQREEAPLAAVLEDRRPRLGRARRRRARPDA